MLFMINPTALDVSKCIPNNFHRLFRINLNLVIKFSNKKNNHNICDLFSKPKKKSQYL